MSNIDYKAEVLKVARAIKIIDHFPTYNNRICIYVNKKLAGSSSTSEQEAWMDAYENLKKEGRIL